MKYLNQLSGESKSGFLKAYKIIKSDLRDDHNEFNLGVNVKGEFEISLTINLKSMI